MMALDVHVCLKLVHGLVSILMLLISAWQKIIPGRTCTLAGLLAVRHFCARAFQFCDR